MEVNGCFSTEGED